LTRQILDENLPYLSPLGSPSPQQVFGVFVRDAGFAARWTEFVNACRLIGSDLDLMSVLEICEIFLAGVYPCVVATTSKPVCKAKPRPIQAGAQA
jgi:hypothetical protein